MTEPSFYQERADVEFAAAQYHLTQAAQHSAKAESHMKRYLSLLPGSGGPSLGGGRVSPNAPNCVRVWTQWLADNGPNLRQEIQNQTGVRFTERAGPYTVAWEDAMAHFPDDHFPPDTLVRIRARSEKGRGAPPVIYFLWSQRFDVRAKFGVGPAKRTAPVEEQQTLLGVVHPPEPTVEMATVDEQRAAADPEVPAVAPPVEEESVAPVRYATMEEWNDRYNPFFDLMVDMESKPTEEEKADLYATLPETVSDPHAAVALAFQAAVQRNRERNDL